ncbi:acyltransferase family protein [Acinetobacter ursingii]|uniref:acyltransferase family protein n=1 Tax=Acinetobacter ursingii TaxID=108980 RepID=UPI003AF662EC
MLNGEKLIGLDLLRFLMCLVMVLFHVQSNSSNAILNFLSFNGFFATSTFFILSGFILTHVYHTRILEPNNTKKFLIKRFSALYPLHIVTLLFFVFLTLFMKLMKGNIFEPDLIGVQTIPGYISKETITLNLMDFIKYVVESVFVLHAWDYRYLFLNMASWSISALMFFYLLFPFLVKTIHNKSNLFFWLIGLWLLYLSIPLYFAYTENFSSNVVGLLHRNPLLRLPEFIAGILLFYILNGKTYVFEKYKYVFIFFGVFGFILTGFLVKFSPEKWFYISHNGLFLFFQISLILGFVFVHIKNTKLRNYISILGKASLTLYMVHLVYINIFVRVYKTIFSLMNASNISDFLIFYKNIDNTKIFSIPILLIFMFSLVFLVSYYNSVYLPPCKKN